jgi:hypothetical protein
MNQSKSKMGALPRGFSAVSADELNQVEGGLFGITWKDVKAAAKFVAAAVVTAVVSRAIK